MTGFERQETEYVANLSTRFPREIWRCSTSHDYLIVCGNPTIIDLLFQAWRTWAAAAGA